MSLAAPARDLGRSGLNLLKTRVSSTFRTASRFRMAALAATAALALAACNQTDAEVARKANKPLTPQMLSLLSQKDMAPASPLLVRIFKKESELEVWKATSDGTYALLKTYPICRWSGELGPKVNMGDRQAPEGFYTITPGQMNPNSSYYLSFNLGFPNAFDRSYGRTGEFLMVHGDCSSAGCYAMTDEQISEIFSLARESFAGGQRAFQVQAYPFRMTPKNLARYRSNPNMAFWRNLKQGYDHFEVTRQEPKVNVCGRQYVFDAQPAPGRGFDAAAACPPYQVAPQVAEAVIAKQRNDDAQIAALAQSSPVAPVKLGADGGMHPVFLAKLKTQRGDGSTAFAAEAPGTIPETTRPPTRTYEEVEGAVPVQTASVPATPSAASTVALAARPGAAPTAIAPQPPAEAPKAAVEEGSGFGHLFGFGREAPPAEVQEPASAPAASAAPLPPSKPRADAAKPATSSAQSKPSANAKPAGSKPQASAAGTATVADTSALVGGAQPIMTVGSFSR